MLCIEAKGRHLQAKGYIVFLMLIFELNLVYAFLYLAWFVYTYDTSCIRKNIFYVYLKIQFC